MRNLMGLAHGADFEWSKTGDVRTEYMENDDEEVDKVSPIAPNAECHICGASRSL